MLVVGRARMDEVDRLAAMVAQDLQVNPEWLAEATLCDGCMVARDTRTDEMLGFAVVRREDACEGHLLALAVDRMHRGLGVGSALLKSVHDVMLRAGAMRLRLEVRADNPKAQAFYARHGFAPEGVESRAYPDGEDAVRLARPL